MVVLVDCDNVLADFTGFILRVVREEFGREYSPDDVVDWDFAALLKSPEEKRILRSEMACIGVANSLDPLVDLNGVGPRAAVATLRARGHKVLCVTSPMPGSPAWCHERTCWLESEVGIGRKDVIFASDKSYVHGDALIDDRLENINEWVEARRGRGLLWDAGWNQGRVDGVRVRSWADVFKELGGA